MLASSLLQRKSEAIPPRPPRKRSIFVDLFLSGQQLAIITSIMKKFVLGARLGFLSLIIFSVAAPPLLAASSANVSRSYSADSVIKPGSIVSLQKNKKNAIELAHTDNAQRILGVAVEKDDSLIAVEPGDNTVQVASSGSAPVLVSTINGDIKVGDTIAVSPFEGIGMKSEPGNRIVGLAKDSFSASSEGAATVQVADNDGVIRTIKVGYVRLNIAVGLDDGTQSIANLTGVQKFVRSLTGHTVSTPRIIVSLVIALLTLAALAVLIYSAIYGSIVSIGRNPLARNAVFRALWHVVWMASLTVGLALLLIYMLLR